MVSYNEKYPLCILHIPNSVTNLVVKFPDEMRKRKEYYAKQKLATLPAANLVGNESTVTPNGSETAVTSTDQTSGKEKEDYATAPSGGVNGTDDEKISLSLEYSHE